MEIENSVTVVTGAGSGIGRSLAEAFGVAGAAVVAADIDDAAAEATAQRIRTDGGRCVALQADAAATDGIEAMIGLADAQYGPVDIFVANAGIVGPPGLGDEAAWEQTLDVNLRAHVRAARLLAPGWVDRGGGYFVSVASAAGLLTQIGAAAYAVTKHAAVGFAEWLAITYGDSGIGVSCVCPMGVDTALLRSIRDAPDPAVRAAAGSITGAGEVISPATVAQMTVDAVRHNTFLVLPHPQVQDMRSQKVADYERWIAGMRRYQATLGR